MNQYLQKYHSMKKVLGEYADKSMTDGTSMEERSKRIDELKDTLLELAIDAIEHNSTIDKSIHGFKKLKSSRIINLDNLFITNVQNGFYVICSNAGHTICLTQEEYNELNEILFPEPVDYQMD